jgi:hypothetical protein
LADLGKSILGILDVDADLSFGDGDLALIHDLARRLVTEPGGLLDDPEYGYALQILLSSPVDAPSIQRRCGSQLLQDERVADPININVAQDLAKQSLTIEIAVTKRDDGTALTFTLEFSKLTVDLLLPTS